MVLINEEVHKKAALDNTRFRGSKRYHDCFPASPGSTLFHVSCTFRKTLTTWRPPLDSDLYSISSATPLKRKCFCPSSSGKLSDLNFTVSHFLTPEPITVARRAEYAHQPHLSPGLHLESESPKGTLR